MMRNAIASGWDISYFLGFEIGEPVHESLADSFWAEGLTRKKESAVAVTQLEINLVLLDFN